MVGRGAYDGEQDEVEEGSQIDGRETSFAVNIEALGEGIGSCGKKSALNGDAQETRRHLGARKEGNARQGKVDCLEGLVVLISIVGRKHERKVQKVKMSNLRRERIYGKR